MRLAYYAGASTAAAGACLLKAFHERPNFYSATVYLSQSNACLLILTNLLLVCACSFIYLLQRILYGPLRPIEIEQLSEKAWYAVLDTLLAMPSFREDVGGWLLTMFVLLLAGKVWGWIGEGRVEILEQQPPANPRLFHARLSTSLALSVMFDIYMTYYCFETVAADPRPGMMVIFTFEFAIQSIFSTFTFLRYLLNVNATIVTQRQLTTAIEERKNEIRAERIAARQNVTEDGRPAPASPPDDEPIEVDENEVDVPGWEDKRRWLFGLEVLSDFLKLMLYIVFFTVSITFNGLPMHIMRDVYMTFASFSKRVHDYVNYKKATSDMNSKYPDATTEEIRGDACIVCREEMIAWEPTEGEQPAAQAAAAARVRRDEGLRAKKLPCGHILHLRCLKAWLERQQVCPTCRRPVITVPPTNTNTNPGNRGAANQRQPEAGPDQRPLAAQNQNRARFFNLGPIRIGFLNGPAGQMNNIMEQLRNGQPLQPAQAQPQPQPPPQQQQQPHVAQAGQAHHGPNHLGLQVPYLQPAGGTNPAFSDVANDPRNPFRSQVQLMQIEQRLMQDANNLNVEHTQLTTLRMMERELARLRAIHASNNSQQTQHQPAVPNFFTPHQALHLPMPSPFQPPVTVNSQNAEVLRGQQTQEMTSGNVGLPQGFVLPEGWTMMPLHRQENNAAHLGSTGPSHPAVQPVAVQHTTPGFPRSGVQTSSDNVASTTGTDTDTTSSTEQSQQRSSAQNGPTDDRGSPLFIPADVAHSQPQVDDVAAASQPQQDSGSEARKSSSARGRPWEGRTGWDFAHGADAASEHDTTESDVNKPSADPTPSSPSYAGKGKGRAVEVEDAPDSEAKPSEN